MEGSVTHFFRRLQQGDEAASQQLWDRYFPRLLGLARKTLAGHRQRMADADDAVQSAFFSFWQRANRGEFVEVDDRDNLWNLLGLITVRKSLNQATRESAKKRGGGAVAGESDLPATNKEGLPMVGLEFAMAAVPAVDVDLLFEEMLMALDEGLRSVALLKLMGYKVAEIAELLDVTERTVTRKTELIRKHWSRTHSDQ